MRLRNSIGLLLLFLYSVTAVSAQDLDTIIPDLYKMANYAAMVAKPGLTESKDITWERLRPTRLSNLTCPLVPGTDLGREVRPYIMRLYYGMERYVVYVSEDGTLAQPCDSKFDTLASVIPPTPTPWPSQTMAILPTTTLTPAATFTPTITPTPAPTATALPATMTCPTDFTGFLAPRIKLGLATARVGDGGSPNRLRDQPSVSGEQIGQIQPGRTINQVLSGPACSDTYVWWFVEMDGIQGWTVESASSDGGSYFLEPLEGFAFPTNTPNAAPVVATASPTLESVVVPTIVVTVPGLLHTIMVDLHDSVREFRFLSDNTLIVRGFENVYVPTLTDDGGMSLQKIIKNVKAFDDTQDALYVLSGDENALVTAQKANPTETTTIPIQILNTEFVSSSLSMTHDGRYFLTGGCNGNCSLGKIELWETASRKVIRSQPAHVGQPNVWFTSDDQRILSLSNDGFQVWDTQSGAFMGGVALPIEWNQTTNPVISADSAYYYIAMCVEIVSGFECSKDKVQLVGWSIKTSEQVTMAALPVPSLEDLFFTTVSSLAISADGLHLAVGFKNGWIQFWSVDPVTRALTQGETLTIGEPVDDTDDKWVSGLAFNADGTELAVGTVSGGVQIWEVPGR